jgi:hypothetical protein
MCSLSTRLAAWASRWELEGDALADGGVLCRKNRTHAAAPEQALDAVLATHRRADTAVEILGSRVAQARHRVKSLAHTRHARRGAAPFELTTPTRAP